MGFLEPGTIINSECYNAIFKTLKQQVEFGSLKRKCCCNMTMVDLYRMGHPRGACEVGSHHLIPSTIQTRLDTVKLLFPKLKKYFYKYLLDLNEGIGRTVRTWLKI